MPAKPKEVVALVLRVMLGCWFAYSGGLKIFGTGLDRFLADVANYRMVGPPLDAWVAYGVPWAELIASTSSPLAVSRAFSSATCCSSERRPRLSSFFR